MKRIFFVLVALSLLLGACGAQPEATPEANAEDIQATAISMAWTMAAQTLEAMPTATLPPTETPTNTPIPPTATLAATLTPIPTATPEKDICDQPLMSWDVGSSPIVVDNRTKEDIVSLSIYVSYTALGECGYVPANSSSFSVPYGCFYAYAYMDGKKKYNTNGGPFCPNNPDKWLLVITESKITLKSP